MKVRRAPSKPRRHVATPDFEGKLVTLNLFGMPLGLAGIGGCWAVAATDLAAPRWPAEAFFGLSAVLWLILSALYVTFGLRRSGTFEADLKHPLSGPFAAYLPLIAILLSTHYSEFDAEAGRWVCVASVVLLGVVAARLVAHWIAGGVALDAVHPGYFVPVVAGANVASIGFSAMGASGAAIAAFGVGLFFWFVVGTVVLVRLMTGPALAVGLKPSMTAFLAAAATSNLAWLVAHPGAFGEVQFVLVGVFVLMVAVQIALLSEYRFVPFGQSWWTFTFPLASTTNFALRWLAEATPAGFETLSWLVLATATAFVLYVGARTAVAALTRRAGRSPERGARHPGRAV
jgi:tellurite resistance protein